MSSDDELFEAARAVRPFLADLIPGEAAAVDRELAGALMSSDPDDVRLDRIAAVFASKNRLTDWIGQFVAGGATPPDVVEIVTRLGGTGAGYKGLAGDPAPLPGTRFICPKRDHVQYVLRRGQAIEPCPTHGLSLVQADR